ncbi:tyrosine-type recombinase/integrase [Brevibacillus formosus]|uniref:tyrosine-type recombinase/integrase n=1 Tax=Brevibacillus formosus TaxID=54913 RepID=UPI0018CD0296|nr:tyrosine-type recombinase/integrase [Brevibacillus formosus]MBG9940576.1 integrase [Brevibacillus formosus]
MSSKFTFIQRKQPGKVIDLSKCIADYLAAKRLERRSDRTIEAYAHTLNQFAKWLEQREDEVITLDVMRDYIHYLTFEKEKWDDHPTSKTGTRGLSARSINNTIRNLRVFFNQLVRERVISTSPMDGINYQTDVKDTFEIYSDDDVIKLLGAPNTRTFTGMRDYTMMLVLIDSLCRLKELTELRVSDVNLKLRQITIRAEIAKTRTTRILPISPKTAKAIEALINYMNVGEDDYLWLTQFGERYLADTFAKMLKNYGRKVGVKGVRVSPHTYRHYGAIKYLRSGGDPISLMRILGHTSLAMTEKYVRFTTSDLSEQHEKASPVTNLLDSGNSRKSGQRKFK